MVWYSQINCKHLTPLLNIQYFVHFDIHSETIYIITLYICWNFIALWFIGWDQELNIIVFVMMPQFSLHHFIIVCTGKCEHSVYRVYTPVFLSLVCLTHRIQKLIIWMNMYPLVLVLDHAIFSYSFHYYHHTHISFLIFNDWCFHVILITFFSFL